MVLDEVCAGVPVGTLTSFRVSTTKRDHQQFSSRTFACTLHFYETHHIPRVKSRIFWSLFRLSRARSHVKDLFSNIHSDICYRDAGQAWRVAFIRRLALAYSPHQGNVLAPVPEHAVPASPSLAPSSQEPYYSNEDIEVLHAVIAAAQEQLDRTPDPKPLPAAALFKAYDDILPQHGIDPDSDSHLSTLVFRVGGEQGPGTLSQKFQSILERMGIVLEFGDESTSSSRSSRSHSRSRSPSPGPSDSSRQYGQRQQSTPGDVLLRKPVSQHDIIIQQDPPASPIAPSQTSVSNHEPKLEKAAIDAPPEVSPSVQDIQNSAPHPLQQIDQQNLVSRFNYGQVESQIDAVIKAVPQVVDSSHLSSKVETRTDSFIAPPEMRRAALASVIDRWRDAMKRQREWSDIKLKSKDVVNKESQQKIQGDDINLGQYEDNNECHVNDQTHQTTLTRPTLVDKPMKPEKATALSNNLPKTPAAEQLQETRASPSQHINTDMNSDKEKHEQLLSRAARAREIYLASKVFNHWADRTATRLEREGVARRHMVRFRCFRGWSHAPSSRVPAIDHLRTTTAVQKLKRAVAYQEEQLSIAASTIARNYRLKTVLRVFDKWLYHLMIQTSRKRAAARVKKNAYAMWESRVTRDTILQQAMLQRKLDYGQSCAFSNWQHQAQLANRRLQAAHHVGMLRLSFNHLEVWVDQTEIERRARAYRERLFLEKAADSFYKWNLTARAQAFRWRSDFLSVTRAADKWLRSRAEHAVKKQVANSCFKKQYTLDFLDVLERASQDEVKLTLLHSRARFFIATTRVLPMMDLVVEKRKNRIKDMVRRYLMMRYTQVSSVRKRRKFYWVLDHWRATASEMSDRAEVAAMSEASHELSQMQDALVKWRKRTMEDSHLQLITSKYHRQAWLATWSDNAKGDEEREMQAWDSWAVGKQRQYLKEWSISSLQRSGQAHTASRVQQKYYGEKRNRTFQQWRQSFEATRKAPSEHDLRFTPMPGASGLRGGWKALSARRYLLKEGLQEHDVATSTVDTPTRWTGLPFAMSLAQSARPMPSVREIDEESTVSSISENLERAELPYRGRVKMIPGLDLPTTTPRAPVPIHLDLDTLSSQKNKSDRLSRSTALRSTTGRLKDGKFCIYDGGNGRTEQIGEIAIQSYVFRLKSSIRDHSRSSRVSDTNGPP
ncbi:hypothetical protein PT974_02739 [Cladobotryum mycophilum]|uniref:Sfi1 spindle body domain-containing protein n=1 Tax=Cladobotryum mycophilum TaxID=491253 RepID=A0ABR0SZ32_9HYPO